MKMEHKCPSALFRDPMIHPLAVLGAVALVASLVVLAGCQCQFLPNQDPSPGHCLIQQPKVELVRCPVGE